MLALIKSMYYRLKLVFNYIYKIGHWQDYISKTGFTGQAHKLIFVPNFWILKNNNARVGDNGDLNAKRYIKASGKILLLLVQD